MSDGTGTGGQGRDAVTDAERQDDPAHLANLLVQAAGDGDAELVKQVLGTSLVDADAQSNERRTGLDQAVRRGHGRVVSVLIEAGADPGQQVGAYRETTPLCLAAAHGHTSVVEALLDAGVHPDTRNRMGHLPLVLAATVGQEGHMSTVDLLLDRGADIDAEMKGRTALDWAAGFGQGRMVRHLLSRAAAHSTAVSVARVTPCPLTPCF
ncbi:ankyrin repeat domain-containing protein [Streptomyces sp. NPDC046465]|uniref:ankyrin repeat domain-containing protein n=1 Tax=Streptomyces sp. NPDC046465 TaxID=3155810 RepID=UPI00340593AD